MGIGRGLGADDKEIIKALSGNESINDPEDFSDKLKSLKTFLGSGNAPELWLLRSSVRSAEFAGHLGLSFGYAHFVNDKDSVEAFHAYCEYYSRNHGCRKKATNKTKII